MQTMTFSRLSLLSHKEQSAFQINFGPKPTILAAGNGYGKSAIAKSLYDTFGAKPHKIDEAWQLANVTSLVEFEINSVPHAMLKAHGAYTLFKASDEPLITTAHVTSDLSPFFAQFFDFRLVMLNKQNVPITPPPSYLFAPYYVDQDRSWVEAWTSFSDFYLNGSRKALAEYHSGLRPNEYYVAQAERNRVLANITAHQTERNAVQSALDRFSAAGPAIQIRYKLDEFQSEIDQFLMETERLRTEQTRYRQTLSVLHEERQLWRNQAAVLENALSEISLEFREALTQPATVECPTCGQHYENGIVEQFGLVADQDILLESFRTAKERIHLLEDQVTKEQKEMDTLQSSLDKISQVLAVRKADISFGDVVAAEGRHEAGRLFSQRMAELDGHIGALIASANALKRTMDETESKQKKAEIYELFLARLRSFTSRLDVHADFGRRPNIQTLKLARGSEGPRGLMAYYYAFLHTAHRYGSSTFCPIVIDAPNQQGQDVTHMPQIMRLILDERPPGSQLIIAAEAPFGATDTDASIVDIVWRKRQVMRDTMFEEVAERLRPFLSAASTI